MTTKAITNASMARTLITLTVSMVLIATAIVCSGSPGVLQILAGPLAIVRMQTWDEGVLFSCVLVPAIISPIVRPNRITVTCSGLGFVAWVWIGYEYASAAAC